MNTNIIAAKELPKQ